ncbi:MAG: hypothetical protein GKR94_32200 [Gammaproteobacteria bacterium]|nr:hypothetical protein [Gammaproteobacteria bacterium]
MDDDEKLRADIVRDMGNSALSPGFIVASSHPVPSRNKPGDNPPHAVAKAQYLRIVPNEFLCTHQHPSKHKPYPIIFEVTDAGFAYAGKQAATEPLDAALTAAGSGAAAAPATAVGFGRGVK